MKSNKCVILGGGGFIGSNLAKKLIKENFEVSIFARNNLKDYPNLNKIKEKINFIRGDFANKSDLKSILEHDSLYFDLISSSNPYSSYLSPFNNARDQIYSHAYFFEKACEMGVKKIIFISSGGGVYGETDATPICENEACNPISPHSIAKLAIEHFLNFYSRKSKIDSMIYRISNAYGPGQIAKEGFGLVPTLIDNIKKHKPPTLFNHGRDVRDFIFIDDLIDAINISFNKKNKHKVYNLGSGIETSIDEVWKLLKKTANSDLKANYVGSRLVDVSRNTLDIRRFKKEFNWRPKYSIEEGLNKTLAFHK